MTDNKKYRKITSREHVLSRPGMYVGGIEPFERKVLVLYDGIIMTKTTTLPEGAMQIFSEILLNAHDAVISPGSPSSYIDVKLSKNGTITISNDGFGIRFKDEKTNEYIPEMIFGNMFSGSNLGEEDRTGSGMHGIGAKATNILSKYFKVTITNFEEGSYYEQTWTNNMSETSGPKISSCDCDANIVTIKYKADFERFGLQAYPDETEYLLRRQCFNISYLTGVPVLFNDEIYEVNHELMMKSYFGNVENFIVTGKDKNFYILDQPGGKILTFVNGIEVQNGIHVKALIDVLHKSMKTKFPKLRRNILTDNVSIFINLRNIKNPAFDSQSKTNLKSPKITVTLSKANVKKILTTWNLPKTLEKITNISLSKELVKTDGKKTKFIAPKEGNHDANWAGGQRARECVLFLGEGTSALGYIAKLISLLKDGKNKYGAVALRGKVINSKKNTDNNLASNNELKEIKKFLGLKEFIDYTDDKNFAQLRYGKVVILADADHDGNHIVGLLLCLFQQKYKSLFKREFVCCYRTPIIRVLYQKKWRPFYTKRSYEEWVSDETKSLPCRYFKGLGSSTDEDIKQDSENIKECIFTLDKEGDEILDKAFGSENLRKEWIYTDIEEYEIKHYVPVSVFVNSDVKLYFIYSNKRCIPHVIDSLKDSQRKIVYTAIQKWGSSKKPTLLKVSDFSSYCSIATNYEHGNASLDVTIQNLVRDFTGSNNLCLFEKSGQFGTRFLAGKDCVQSRYGKTCPNKLLTKVFRREDEGILKYNVEEGKQIEPEVYYPIVPLVLINGTNGIGTGWATGIPNFNPLEIIEWIRCKIGDKKLPHLKPWYKGFKGEIIEEKGDFYSRGCMEQKDNTVIITEIPITKTPSKYVVFLGKLKEKKMIKSFIDNSKSDDIKFVIKLKIPNKLKYNDFKLEDKIKTNYVLIKDERPFLYETIEAILEDFFEHRLSAYKRRKEYICTVMAEEVRKLSDKIRFLKLVVEEKIELRNTPKEELMKIMEGHKLDYELTKLPLNSLARENIKKFEALLEKKNSDIKKYKEKEINTIWLEELDELEKSL